MKFDESVATFSSIAKTTGRDEREAKVIELAQLSLGRVYFELGKFDLAIDAYQQVSQKSDAL
jgi:hypothetical protein